MLQTLLLQGCLPDPLPIEVEPADVKLVVSGQVVPGSFMLVTVSRSFSALEGSYGAQMDEGDLEALLVTDAEVVLRYGGRTDTLVGLADAPGVYASLLRLDGEDLAFRLDVRDRATGQAVWAESTMLPRVPLDNAQVKGLSNEGFGDSTFQLRLQFNDPEGENWYVVDVFDPNRLGTGAGGVFGLGGGGHVYTLLLSDKQMAGPVMAVDATMRGFGFGDTVVVMLSHISEAYFRYIDARQRGGNILSSLTGEPVNYPSNVVNGYGFFNTHNPSLRQVLVE